MVYISLVLGFLICKCNKTLLRCHLQYFNAKCQLTYVKLNLKKKKKEKRKIFPLQKSKYNSSPYHHYTHIKWLHFKECLPCYYIFIVEQNRHIKLIKLRLTLWIKCGSWTMVVHKLLRISNELSIEIENLETFMVIWRLILSLLSLMRKMWACIYMIFKFYFSCAIDWGKKTSPCTRESMRGIPARNSRCIRTYILPFTLLKPLLYS